MDDENPFLVVEVLLLFFTDLLVDGSGDDICLYLSGDADVVLDLWGDKDALDEGLEDAVDVLPDRPVVLGGVLPLSFSFLSNLET